MAGMDGWAAKGLDCWRRVLGDGDKLRGYIEEKRRERSERKAARKGSGRQPRMVNTEKGREREVLRAAKDTRRG